MVSVEKAPVTQEELGIILLVNAFSETKCKSINTFIKQALVKLANKGMVDIRSNKASLTEAANPVLETIDVGIAPIKHDFIALAQKMRELFPAGNKPETTHAWRSSTPTVVDRLNYLVRQGYQFTDEEALEATKAYVRKNRGEKFMRTLQYFIFKYKPDDSGEKRLLSDLYTEIELIRDGVMEQETEITDFL